MANAWLRKPQAHCNLEAGGMKQFSIITVLVVLMVWLGVSLGGIDQSSHSAVLAAQWKFHIIWIFAGAGLLFTMGVIVAALRFKIRSRRLLADHNARIDEYRRSIRGESNAQPRHLRNHRGN